MKNGLTRLIKTLLLLRQTGNKEYLREAIAIALCLEENL